ncbi:uncharacterized protein LOC124259231 isoform X3 [Haliotis rubra]|uniref:uncharacterized protein LOC124259231 isoform X1 n=1 Tax=Haliotis rubra TaxID=36100 RepID=UPI001EE5D994|nr:uncharacterized protein LOC124259231 isoform X1 [Haliotis rubra]XP_046549300.1 uncharacterized protein LOC124259231 isoform X1 [Haliotis rubra]XP_046549301.1 uncharacterized protein LOC124259231 isoform X2 [Haliotis rubra]XP_046549303.1 uncharacterized protein LOC124259231 isoform X3 [Haliotis rubra]
MTPLWMDVCLIVFLATVVSVGSTQAHVRVKRKPGDRPKPGQCLTFNKGGTSGFHYYACCNNINGTDKSCDGRTYQRASTTSYCNSGGTDNGNGVIKAEFACGGCPGQGIVAKKCKPMKIFNIPGTCWLFTKCFKKYCKKRYSVQSSGLNMQVVDPSSTSMPDTCYNTVCETGETPDNCPVDCCFKMNPSQCTWVTNGTCIPEFCDTPSCSESGGTGLFSAKHTSNIGGLVLGLVILSLYMHEYE